MLIEARGALGTGVFIAPGQVLTCAHVVARAAEHGDSIVVRYKGSEYAAQARVVEPSPPAGELPNPYPWPDLAWLSVEFTSHPCAQVDSEPPLLSPREDRVWAFGYTRAFDPSTMTATPGNFYVEGPIGEIESRRWQLRNAQAPAGMSGAPILNIRTGRLLGLLTRSRNPETELGAWAIAISDAFGRSPRFAELSQSNQTFHELDGRWSEARRTAGVEIGLKPRLVVGWAADIQEENMQQALAATRSAADVHWAAPGLNVRPIQYSLGIPGQQFDPSQVSDAADIVMLLTDALGTSAVCMELGRAAAASRIAVVVLSPGPGSTDTALGINELEQSTECTLIDTSEITLDAAVTQVVFAQAAFAQRVLDARHAGVPIGSVPGGMS